jgi:hypothetical protein
MAIDTAKMLITKLENFKEIFNVVVFRPKKRFFLKKIYQKPTKIQESVAGL